MSDSDDEFLPCDEFPNADHSEERDQSENEDNDSVAESVPDTSLEPLSRHSANVESEVEGFNWNEDLANELESLTVKEPENEEAEAASSSDDSNWGEIKEATNNPISPTGFGNVEDITNADNAHSASSNGGWFSWVSDKAYGSAKKCADLFETQPQNKFQDLFDQPQPNILLSTLDKTLGSASDTLGRAVVSSVNAIDDLNIKEKSLSTIKSVGKRTSTAMQSIGGKFESELIVSLSALMEENCAFAYLQAIEILFPLENEKNATNTAVAFDEGLLLASLRDLNLDENIYSQRIEGLMHQIEQLKKATVSNAVTESILLCFFSDANLLYAEVLLRTAENVVSGEENGSKFQKFDAQMAALIAEADTKIVRNAYLVLADFSLKTLRSAYNRLRTK